MGSCLLPNAPHDYAAGATPCRWVNTNVVYKTPPNVPAVNRNVLISCLKNPGPPFCGKSGGSTPGSECIIPGIKIDPTSCLIPADIPPHTGHQREHDDAKATLHSAIRVPERKRHGCSIQGRDAFLPIIKCNSQFCTSAFRHGKLLLCAVRPLGKRGKTPYNRRHIAQGGICPCLWTD